MQETDGVFVCSALAQVGNFESIIPLNQDWRLKKMKTVALISGGKDSCFNMMQCVAAGHQLVALANLRPKDKGKKVPSLD